jgi:hypothetical protein
MIDAFNWWWSLQRNAKFLDWVRDTYSDEGLLALTTEATDCNLLESYNPFGDETMEQHWSRLAL